MERKHLYMNSHVIFAVLHFQWKTACLCSWGMESLFWYYQRIYSDKSYVLHFEHSQSRGISIPHEGFETMGLSLSWVCESWVSSEWMLPCDVQGWHSLECRQLVSWVLDSVRHKLAIWNCVNLLMLSLRSVTEFTAKLEHSILGSSHMRYFAIRNFLCFARIMANWTRLPAKWSIRLGFWRNLSCYVTKMALAGIVPHLARQMSFRVWRRTPGKSFTKGL